jgi:ubiquinone/menaquinone biosynthesis C-methylase UbiE
VYNGLEGCASGEEGMMNTLAFTGDIARLQQAIAESHDLVLRRSTVLETLNLRTGERVLELGCGGGYFAREAAQFVGAAGRVFAIDISPDQIAAARARCAEFAWVECREADIAAPPFGNAEFDVVFAVQALEYVPDLEGALGHIRRLLRPGGRLVIVATDWSSAVWHSENAQRMQRVLAAWAPHTPCQDLPSILGGRLRQAGLQLLRQTAIPILNTSYNLASFSYWVAQVIRPFVVSRQSVTEREATEWHDEFADLEERGAYFFCVTPVLTEAVKLARSSAANRALLAILFATTVEEPDFAGPYALVK